jgi:adenylosuccinate synthase
VVIKDEKYVLHLIPSGVLHRGKKCVIGNGVVIDPAALIAEIDGLKARGIEIGKNLFVSKNAHVIMPYHMAVERESEQRKGAKKIGTTCRGIGPAYTDKIARHGIRIHDLLHPEILREKLTDNLAVINFLLESYFGAAPLKAEEIFDLYVRYAGRIAEYAADTDLLVNREIDAGNPVLLEGAQGTMLDVDHGTYPYVTSSNTIAGGACTGLGVSPRKIDRVLGVTKAYTTRVGEGPFPTVIKDALGERIREKGGEFGATTGRPRRCGWLDLVVLRHSLRINGLSGFALTKLDILDGLDKVKICVGYRHNGRTIDEFPKEVSVLDGCVPVYEEMPGWRESTLGVTDMAGLPDEAARYIETIERMLGLEAEIISTGQRRHEIIIRKEQFQ